LINLNNFDVLLVPQCTNAYHILNESLVISFMWVHKWMVMHMNLLNIYFKPKFKKICTMELVFPLTTVDFAGCNFLLEFFGFNNTT
jgi:hypothetical protein